MNIISWEKRPDGSINVWSSPVRGQGKKRVIKDPDSFFEVTRSITPDGACGLTTGKFGFCFDPGLFRNNVDYVRLYMSELIPNINATIGEWTLRQKQSAMDAMIELCPEIVTRKHKTENAVYQLLVFTAEYIQASAHMAHEWIECPENGINAVTRRHKAAALRALLHHMIPRVMRICDMKKMVDTIHQCDMPFKLRFENTRKEVALLCDLNAKLKPLLNQQRCSRDDFTEEYRLWVSMREQFRITRLHKLINSRHPRLGRKGSYFPVQHHGKGFEAERARHVCHMVEARFNEVIDILGLELVIAGAKID